MARRKEGRDTAVTRTVCAPANFLLNRLRGILYCRVRNDVCTGILRQAHFFCSDIDGHNMHAHGFSVLNGDVAQTAHGGDGHPFGWSASRVVSGLCTW